MSPARILVPLLPVVALLVVLASTKSGPNPLRVRAPTIEPPTIEPPTPRRVAVVDVPVAARRPEGSKMPVVVTPPTTRAPEPRSWGPPTWEPGEEERHFKWLRETSDEQALERELDELSETLHEQCAAEIRARVATGEVERIAADEEGNYPVPLPRRGVVEFVSGGPDLGLVRVHIPEAAVPAAYETQRRIDWLRDLIP